MKMNRIKEAIQLKRPDQKCSVIIQHDNAHPHDTNETKHAIKELSWKILPHQSYSDLAPLDYHRFSNNLRGALFNNNVEL